MTVSQLFYIFKRKTNNTYKEILQYSIFALKSYTRDINKRNKYRQNSEE